MNLRLLAPPRSARPRLRRRRARHRQRLRCQRRDDDERLDPRQHSVYDFEGDGAADVVYSDEVNLYVYSGNDGTVKLKFAQHNSGTRLEQPVVADVDADGQVEIVGTVAGITVLGDMNMSWRPGRKFWNQHAYHITKISPFVRLRADWSPNRRRNGTGFRCANSNS